jgi:hypothetical protein
MVTKTGTFSMHGLSLVEKLKLYVSKIWFLPKNIKVQKPHGLRRKVLLATPKKLPRANDLS